MKVYYLGPEGTFSYQAAVKYQPHADLVPCQSLYEVVEQFNQHTNSQAIVPIENAIEGTINLIADELIENQLHVIGEVYLDIAFDVVGLTPSMEHISSVVSIAPIISQTKRFITDYELDVKHSDSSLDSLNYIDHETVAIIPHQSTTAYPVITEHIEDYPYNKTRFLVLSHQETSHPTTQALLLLTPKVDKPGLLANILNVFNLYNINLSWIESRPTKQQFGCYHFLIQCQIAASSDDYKQVLKIFEALEITVRTIGAF
ncbi:prephenate dehydratase [Macrococcus equipercicus]|uniref:Prephenate dehydratase n=2 Tax=Macrococcus equipercicus TaxID=69967 RepID=A0A9Q9BNI5_9STAP|nr:prephenate dehydratase domain-containing protein [Macrococcus equipercicus]KAA1039571.1 prephenate dehydratase [Macrococcus equipercicus]UTH14808.1 prephenate dehydratase [Macrococcus equipercicus]